LKNIMTIDNDNNESKGDLLGDDLDSAESLLDTKIPVESASKGDLAHDTRPSDEDITKEDPKTVIDAKLPLKKNVDLRIYKTNGTIVVRMGGRNYTSKDSNMPDNVRQIMSRVANGDSLTRIIGDYRKLGGASRGKKDLSGISSRAYAAITDAGLNVYYVVIAVLTIVLLIQIISIIKN